MKVLTASSRTQGQRGSDFTWCIDGELVTPHVVICGKDLADPDGGCGCGRAFSGLNSHTSTTTAMVRDLDWLTFEDLTEAVRQYRVNTGYAELAGDEAGELVQAEAADIAETAAEYDDGAVLEIRLGEIAERGPRHLRSVQ